MSQDRATIFAAAVLRITADAFREWLYGEDLHIDEVRDRIAAAARDEFASIERMTRDDIRVDD